MKDLDGRCHERRLAPIFSSYLICCMIPSPSRSPFLIVPLYFPCSLLFSGPCPLPCTFPSTLLPLATLLYTSSFVFRFLGYGHRLPCRRTIVLYFFFYYTTYQPCTPCSSLLLPQQPLYSLFFFCFSLLVCFPSNYAASYRSIVYKPSYLQPVFLNLTS